MENLKIESVYNSKIEMSLRIAKILIGFSPIGLSIEKIICIDFLVLNLNDYMPGLESLHPAVPRRDTQLAITRKIFTDSLELLKGCNIVKEKFTRDGILFMVTDKTFSFTNAVQNNYISRMELNIRTIREEYGSFSDNELKRLVASKFGKLDMEVNNAPLL